MISRLSQQSLSYLQHIILGSFSLILPTLNWLEPVFGNTRIYTEPDWSYKCLFTIICRLYNCDKKRIITGVACRHRKSQLSLGLRVSSFGMKITRCKKWVRSLWASYISTVKYIMPMYGRRCSGHLQRHSSTDSHLRITHRCSMWASEHFW